MSTPRTVEQLVDSVTVDPGESVDRSMLQAPWVQAFLASPAMNEVTRREIFAFRVYCAWLLRTPTHQTVTKSILRKIQQRFFVDTKFYQPSIHFTDIHNVVDEIFRLVFENEKIYRF